MGEIPGSSYLQGAHTELTKVVSLGNAPTFCLNVAFFLLSLAFESSASHLGFERGRSQCALTTPSGVTVRIGQMPAAWPAPDSSLRAGKGGAREECTWRGENKALG